tara:strand:- start:176 stop:295 length:120 start_codon:yes stop_codon:yes gene_type:complete
MHTDNFVFEGDSTISGNIWTKTNNDAGDLVPGNVHFFLL